MPKLKLPMPLLVAAIALYVLMSTTAHAAEKQKRPSLWERSGTTQMAGWLVAPKVRKKAPKSMKSNARVVYSDEKLVIVDPFED